MPLQEVLSPPCSHDVDKHQYEDLVRLFDRVFSESENTRLIRGEGEPVYLPASSKCHYHQVVFAHGYFSSALHEISHWCVAGPERRKLEDFGYWYKPDGRTTEEQALFEQVEVVPQAFEWILSVAAGFAFRISADNLSGQARDNTEFITKVHKEVQRRLVIGLPKRLGEFVAVLQGYYQQENSLCSSRFLLKNL